MHEAWYLVALVLSLLLLSLFIVAIALSFRTTEAVYDWYTFRAQSSNLRGATELTFSCGLSFRPCAQNKLDQQGKLVGEGKATPGEIKAHVESVVAAIAEADALALASDANHKLPWSHVARQVALSLYCKFPTTSVKVTFLDPDAPGNGDLNSHNLASGTSADESASAATKHLVVYTLA